MNNDEQLPAVRSYLSELRSALAGTPREIATEIEDGVAEELAGLSASEALRRIDEMGDPAFIAAEARASSASGPSTPSEVQAPLVAPLPTAPGAPNRVATTEARWFIVVASLLVAFGGIVIPVLGWIAGIVMVWMSKSWRAWEKWVGTLVPLLVGGVFAMGSLMIMRTAQSGMVGGLTGWHTVILSVFVTPFFAGMWLLWRGLRR